MGAIITIATSKGGGGKTATAITLASNLAAHGLRVVVIDADKNATFSSWHREAYEGPSFPCIVEIRHVEVVDLAQAQAENTDVVLIDTAGFENLTAACAIGCSDHVLIPCMPDRGSVAEAIKTARQTAGMARGARRPIPASVILTRWNARGVSERAALIELHAAGLSVLAAHLPDLAVFGQTSWSGAAPTKGRLGLHADRIIEHLAAAGAIYATLSSVPTVDTAT